MSGPITSSDSSPVHLEEATVASTPTQPVVKATGTAPNNVHFYLREHRQNVLDLNWNALQENGTILFSAPITPLHSTPICQYVARLYNTWTGGVMYTLMPVATNFQAGKLGMAWLPPNKNPKEMGSVQNLTAFPHAVVDVRDQSETTLACGDMTKSKFHFMDETMGTESIGGYFVVFVHNRLVATGQTTASTTVNISAQCEFNFYQVVPPSVGPVTNVQNLLLKVHAPVNYGLNFGSLAILEDKITKVNTYLDGVMKGSGTPLVKAVYTGNKRPILADKLDVAQGENEPFRLGVFALPSLTFFGLSVADCVYFLSMKWVTDEKGSRYHIEGSEQGDPKGVELMYCLPGYAAGTQSIDYDPASWFEPKGSVKESILAFLGSAQCQVHEFPMLTHFPCWQVPQLPVPEVEGRAYYGQIVDGQTRVPICYYKTYFEGISTTSPVASTQHFERDLEFVFIAEVEESFNLPAATAEMTSNWFTLSSHAYAKRNLKTWQQRHYPYFSGQWPQTERFQPSTIMSPTEWQLIDKTQASRRK